LHQVQNKSTENRYHIIMDAYDTQHQTDNFKYRNDINVLQNQADEYRQKMDQIQLTGEEIEYFTKIKQQYLKS